MKAAVRLDFAAAFRAGPKGEAWVTQRVAQAGPPAAPGQENGHCVSFRRWRAANLGSTLVSEPA